MRSTPLISAAGSLFLSRERLVGCGITSGI
jgi:hypothetical protein